MNNNNLRVNSLNERDGAGCLTPVMGDLQHRCFESIGLVVKQDFLDVSRGIGGVASVFALSITHEQERMLTVLEPQDN
ncbi:MAG: hypothetical protein WD795_08170 [Woeseia sp.]